MDRNRTLRARGWHATARIWAKEAWAHDSRRCNGIYRVQANETDTGYFVIYSNYPDVGFPQLRAQVLAAIRCRLRAAGMSELAYAIYPHAEGGYTDALVLDAGAAREETVEGLVSEAMDDCWQRRAPTPAERKTGGETGRSKRVAAARSRRAGARRSRLAI